MNITKFVNYKQRDILKSIAGIIQIVLDTDKKISLQSLYGLIENPDTSYHPKSIEDVIFALNNAKGIHKVFLDIGFEYSDEARKYIYPKIELQISKNSILSVQIGFPETKLTLEVFDRLKEEVFKKDYYKYNKKPRIAAILKMLVRKWLIYLKASMNCKYVP